MKKFNVDSWYGLLLTTQADFLSLKFYISNKKAQFAYIEDVTPSSIPIVSSDKNNVENKKEDIFSKENLDFHMNPIYGAYNNYSNQVIVVLSTYLEGIIQDFFEVFYLNRNNKIKTVNGFIDLSLIMNAKTHKEKLSILSKIAAQNSNKGNIRRKISRIEQICNTQLYKNFGLELDTIIKGRNKIVHENKYLDIHEIQIEKSIKVIISFLKQLGIILKKNNIKITNDSGLCGE